MIYLVCSQHGGILQILKTDKPFEEVEKETLGTNFGEFLVQMTLENLEELLAVLDLVKLECPSCQRSFLVETSYEGAITCPYCGELVEDN